MEPDDYRVTIRLSPQLYGQLEARGSHGQPLAAIVREALEAFLAQPRQPPADMAAMTASLATLQAQVEHLAGQLAALAANRQPPAAIPAIPAAERLPMAARRPTPPAPAEGVTATVPGTGPVPAPFDATKYRLGKLCPRGHAYRDTGQSLRTNSVAGYCLQCNAEDVRARRAARRQREGRP